MGLAACGVACSPLSVEPKVIEKAKVQAVAVLLPRVAGPAVAFSPDGRQLATGSLNGRVHFWGVGTWREVGTLEPTTDTSAYSVEFSSDGRWLISQSSTPGRGPGASADVWDVGSSRKQLSLPLSSTLPLAVLQPNFFVLQPPQENAMTQTIRLRVLEVGSWRELASRTFEGQLVSLVSSTHSQRVAVTLVKRKREREPVEASILVQREVRFPALPAQTEVRVVEPPDLHELCALPPDNVALTFSPDGVRLASMAGQWWLGEIPIEGTPKVWEVPSGREVRTFGSRRRVDASALSPDGRFLAIGGFSSERWELWESERLELWEIDTGKKRTVKVYATAIAFSPDGRFLAGGSGETIALWDLARDRVQMLAGGGYRHTYIRIAFSPDSRWLAVAISDDAVRVWDVQKFASVSQ